MNETRIHTLYPSTAWQPLPSLAVCIINSRGVDNPWYRAALTSALNAQYPGPYQVAVLDNNGTGLEERLTIGAARNLFARTLDAEFVLFLDDDDQIVQDCPFHLVTALLHSRKQPGGEALIMSTCYVTLLDDQGRRLGLETKYHTGLYDRLWLADNPFDEELLKHVDTELHNRIAARSKYEGKALMRGSPYYFGYLYRQHIGQTSGFRVQAIDPNAPSMRVHN